MSQMLHSFKQNKNSINDVDQPTAYKMQTGVKFGAAVEEKLISSFNKRPLQNRPITYSLGSLQAL